uniref:MORN repeat-containing protein n=1 Tax=Panagrolaimus sp. JU765 TaxID=591449 RepID=A0AC34R7E6_9BILA
MRTENLPQNFWKHFDRTLERNEGYAKQTYAAHKDLSQFGIENINRPGRLIIWTSHESAESTSHIKVKDAGSNLNSSSPWRRFIGTNFTSIVIFSDSFALIQSGSQVFLESPLVWMNCLTGQDSVENGIESTMTESEKELTVQVLSPEYEFHIEFPAVEMKNDMLNAFSASFRLHRERTELSVFEDSNGTSVHVLPQTRFGSHDYSPTHYLYRNCRYEGYWKNGVPHGQGCLKYPDGREYKGRFEHGIIQGFGEMKIPELPTAPSPLMSSMFFADLSPKKTEKYHHYKGKWRNELPTAPSPLMSSMFFTDLSPKKTEKYHHYKGKWRNGKLHGLAHIVYSNGDTYEGYCANGLPDGHGVLRSSESGGGQQVYVGGWLKGAKNGYGVLSLNKERYLGMWKDDLRHGKGCQITIDGIFHEGIFDKNRFTKGRIVYQANDSDSPASFEGEFEKMGVVSGKGILRLTPQDQIEGLIYGQILTGELKITNATYSHKEICPINNSSLADLQFVE